MSSSRRRICSSKTGESLKHFPDDSGDLSGEQRRHCISHLCVLEGSGSLEEVVVRECLEPGGFTNSKTATLGRIGVDIVMTIF